MIVISDTYNDLTSTNYPNKIDTQLFFADPTVEDLELINQYYGYINSKNLNAASQLLIDNPQLNKCINNAAKETRREHQIIALQRQYLSDFQKYVVEAIKYRNEWLANIKYYKFNVVMYSNGLCYCAVADDIPIGDLPTNTQNWIPWSIKGDTGMSGLGMTPRGIWSGTTQYYMYDVVSRSNALWYAKADNIGITPGSNEAIWEVALGAAMIDLGVSSNIAGVLSADHGGTGVASIDELKINLDVPNKTAQIEASISHDKWMGSNAPYTATMTVDGLVAGSKCMAGLSPSATPEQREVARNAIITPFDIFVNNTIQFVADGEKPEMGLPIVITVWG